LMCQPAQLCNMQWQWAGSHGRWHRFDAGAQNQLEAAYQEWMREDHACGALRLQAGSFVYEINFGAMMQMNTTSKRQRSICREATHVRWLWWDGKGRHHAFDAVASVWLEEQYQAWEAHGFHDERHLNVGDHTYEIDLGFMLQRNTVSGRERSIMRKIESCLEGVGESSSCTVSGRSCSVCGCIAEFDAWGDRTCWCDSCWSTGCCTSGTLVKKGSSLKQAMAAEEDNLEDRAMRASRETVVGDMQPASHSRVSACQQGRNTRHRHVTLKASLGNDVRRLLTTWPLDASHENVLAAVRMAVQRGFSSLLKTGLTFELKYADDDGDMCSLVVETMEDWLAFGSDGTLRLVVVHQLNASIPGPVATPSTLPSEPESSNTVGEEHDFAWNLVEPPEALCKTVS